VSKVSFDHAFERWFGLMMQEYLRITTLKALDVELTEAEEAKAAPVMLPAASLVQARAALEGATPGNETSRESA
jgi:hypothetical protein